MTARLLVVEDSVTAAGALRLLFEASGYSVFLAHSVAEAVALATREAIDIILLDLTLPDGDGLHALRELRALGRLPRAVVALTGHDADDVRERCLAAGCCTVLVKPVPARELLALVRSL